QPVVRQRAQLLLDALDRSTQRRPPRQRLLNINPTRIKPHRVKAREPTHRPRQVDIGEHLLTPVTLQINKHRRPAPAPPPPPPHRPLRPHSPALRRRRQGTPPSLPSPAPRSPPQKAQASHAAPFRRRRDPRPMLHPPAQATARSASDAIAPARPYAARSAPA